VVGCFLGMSGVRYRLDVPDQLPETPLSSEARHNLFLVVKETLNNIVKHAEATEVWFRLSLQDSTLSISIEDNGKGFEISQVSITGNGLQNMQARIEKIGGSYCVASDLGRGTQTKIRLPVKN
jgi:signal transduction histidine kinase